MARFDPPPSRRLGRAGSLPGRLPRCRPEPSPERTPSSSLLRWSLCDHRPLALWDDVRLESQEIESTPGHSSLPFEHFLPVAFPCRWLAAVYGSRAGTAVRAPVLSWRRKGPGQPRQRQARTHRSRDGPLGCWTLPRLDGLLPFTGRSAAGSSSGVTVPSTGSASGPSGALEVSWLLSFLTCLVETSNPAGWALPPWGGVGPGRTSPPGEAGLCRSSATCC